VLGYDPDGGFRRGEAGIIALYASCAVPSYNAAMRKVHLRWQVELKGGGKLKRLSYRSAVLVTTVLMVVMMFGNALPALAVGPVDPTCGWDWDRYLWQQYKYELWFYTCDYGDDNVYVYAFWNPDWGYWYP
jgi:hypothetical protein